MTTYSVTVKPGVTAPAGAVDVPLSNIRPSMQPVGPIKTIMDQLTGAYNAFERAASRRPGSISMTPISSISSISFFSMVEP